MVKAGTTGLNILHLSTWNEICGIADYSKEMTDALANYGVVNKIHPVDKQNRKYMAPQEVEKNLVTFLVKAQDADLIHIQHEFSFFSETNLKYSIDNFYKLLKRLSKLKKPVVVTFHTEIDFFDADKYTLLHDRNLKHLQKYILKKYWQNKISRFFKKDRFFHAILHTKQTRLKLIRSGFCANNIIVMPLGISPRDNLIQTNKSEAKQTLNYPKDIILLSIFGFIGDYKGHEFAIKALRLLPEKYHLAIVGGLHPETNDLTLDKILALSHATPAIKDRIRITGYVEAKTRDLYHAATDICLAPYHGNMSGSGAIGWALSSGKPIIAGKISTFKEINQQADCFLLCLQKSVFELAWQIERLTADPHLQAKLVKNALTYAADNQWSKIALNIINYYEKCLGKIYSGQCK